MAASPPPQLVRAPSSGGSGGPAPVLQYRVTDSKTALRVEPWVSPDQLAPKPDDVGLHYHSIRHTIAFE
jgi:hypothetical protein